MRNILTFLFFYAFVFYPIATDAKTLNVDSDGGTEYSTIQQAIEAAEPGDTILLSGEGKTYYQSAQFHNKKGTAENPITLDGNGAVLNGSEPLRAQEWKEVSPNLYRSTEFPLRMRMQNSVLGRFYFIIDEKVNRMNRSSKGVRAPFKRVSELVENEWTYEEEEKAFYIRLRSSDPITSVRAPERANGVALRGENEHLIIRNITATHVWNDGFNIHGWSRNILFENIRAIECGDDGVSAHGDCHIEVNGLFSSGNSTGFCHVGESESVSRNIFLEQNHGHAIYLVNQSKHRIENGIVRSLKRHALRLTSGTSLTLKNVAFYAENAHRQGWTVQGESTLEAEDCLVFGLPIELRDAHVTLRNSLIDGPGAALSIEENTEWHADRNIWNIPKLEWRGKKYSAAKFSEYQHDSQQDQHSFFPQSTSAAVSEPGS